MNRIRQEEIASSLQEKSGSALHIAGPISDDTVPLWFSLMSMTFVLTCMVGLIGIQLGTAQERPIFDVKSFGAKGDGVSDDVEAVQQAVDAAAGVDGCVVFPSGTYLFSRMTRGSSFLGNYFVKLRSNILLRGDTASVIKLRDGFLSGDADSVSNAHFLVGDLIENVTITGLTFDMNSAKNLTPPESASYSDEHMHHRWQECIHNKECLP